MKLSRAGLFICAVGLVAAGRLPAATVSLDTVGADPDLNSPNFTFTTDQLGNFSAIYRNVSNPPVDFTTLRLVAPFSAAFYNGPTGPRTVGAGCDGGSAFSICNIIFLNSQFTLIFEFSGIDATHFGIPYNREFGIVARLFEPSQTVNAAANASTSAVPEPGAFGYATLGLALCGLAVTGKKFLKPAVRS